MKHRAPVLPTLVCLVLTACAPNSRSGEIAATPGGLRFEFSSNTADAPPALGQAEVGRNDVLRCTYQGTDPETGDPLRNSTTVTVPGLFQRLEAVLSVSSNGSEGSNSDNGLGQNRTAPYRSPTGQIIDVLNAATSPAPCMPIR